MTKRAESLTTENKDLLEKVAQLQVASAKQDRQLLAKEEEVEDA